jgi:hypothetical protein
MNSPMKSIAKDELRLLSASNAAGMMRRCVRPALGLAMLLALSCGIALAQQSSEQTGTGHLSNNPLRLDRRDGGQTADESTIDPALEQRQLHDLNARIHKSIVLNTEKLLKLVTEFNAEISSTNPASLTPEQLRKVAVIEKLAHDLRNEMRSPIKDPPPFIDLAKPLTNYPDRR